MLNVIMGVLIVAAWLAVGGTSYRSRRRALRQQAEWERLRASLSWLDAELDRTWAEEQERIRRH
jgi:hypothetical protein